MSRLLSETALGLKLWILGLRKTVVAIAYIVLATILLVAGYLPGETWLSSVTNVVVAFFATNSAEWVVKAIQTHLDKKK